MDPETARRLLQEQKNSTDVGLHVGCFPLFPGTCRPSPLQGSGDAIWKNAAPPGRDREGISPPDKGGRVRPEPASDGRFSGGTKAREIAGFRIGFERSVASAGPREAAWGRREAVQW